MTRRTLRLIITIFPHEDRLPVVTPSPRLRQGGATG